MLRSDAELVAFARARDVEAFDRLIERYERTRLAAVLTKLHDIHAAEDVAPDLRASDCPDLETDAVSRAVLHARGGGVLCAQKRAI
jgi:hypothetical protein